MLNVHITSMTLTRSPKVNSRGVTTLAYFDCTFLGITMYGCTLARTRSGQMFFSPPPADTSTRHRREVMIRNPEIYNPILAKAEEAHQRLSAINPPREVTEDAEGDRSGLKRFLAATAEA